MEIWQENHIKSNLSDLIKNTEAHVMVLAHLRGKNILSDYEVQDLQNKQRTPLENAALLYDCIRKKTSGYVNLIKALMEEKQSGAYTILLTISSEMINNLRVGSDEGFTNRVTDLLDGDQVTTIEKWVNENLSDDERLRIHETVFSKKKKAHLWRNTLPPPYPLYIDRFLSRSVNVDTNLFSESCPDVFVFKNIKLNQLSARLGKSGIWKNCEKSGKQVIKGKLTSRFIILDIKDDWEKICDIAKKQEIPVHVFSYEMETDSFLLEKSTVLSSVLRGYIKKGGTPESCTEGEFVDKIAEQNTKGFCICDLPGMGKTLLLENLARKISKNYPDRVVAYVSLRNLELPEETRTSKDAKLKMLNYISTSKLSSHILLELGEAGKIKFELFFDALDEVEPYKLQYATDFLKKICKNMPETRVYVTSRPVVCADLEDSLGVIAYNIVPFDEETQLKYLTEHWKNTSCLEERLKEYGKECLKSLKYNLKEYETDIAGTPLQCKLVAEVHCNRATAFANKNRGALPLADNFESSLSEIYLKYMERQFGEAKCKFNCVQHFFCSKIKPCKDTMCRVKSFHIWKSIQLIFPDIFNEWFKKHSCLFDEIKIQNILAPGLLKKREDNNAISDDLEFVHLTFAEYLAADFFSKAFLTKPESPEEQQKTFQLCLFSQIFKRSSRREYVLFGRIFNLSSDGEAIKTSWFVRAYKLFYHVVGYFLNALIGNQDTYVFCKDVLKLGRLEGCMHHRFHVLLDLYLEAVKNRGEYPEYLSKHNETKYMSDDDKDNYDDEEEDDDDLENILMVAAATLDVENVKKLCNFFKHNFKINLISLQYCYSGKLTPTECAIKRGDIEITEYLVTETMSLKGTMPFKGLFYTCVKETNFDNSDLVDKKLEIAKMLLTKRSSLLTDTDEFDTGNPILARDMHLKAVKFLCENGSDFRDANESGRNLLYFAGTCMSTRDFIELCNYLNNKYNALDDFLEPKTLNKLFRPDTSNKTKMLLKVVQYLGTRSTTSEETVKKIELDDAETCEYRDLGYYEILTTLLNAEFYKNHSKIFTILFNAAIQEGFVKVAKIILHYDPSLVTKPVCRWGVRFLESPILFVVDDIEIFEFLVEEGANIYEVDAKGRTILHIYCNRIHEYRNNRHSMIQYFMNVLECIGKQWERPQNHTETSHSDTSTYAGKPKNLKELFNWPTTICRETPLHIFALTYFEVGWHERFNYSLILELILTGGRGSRAEIVVNVNAQDYWGNTALHNALLDGLDLEETQRFVKSGINLKIKNKKGLNVADICKENRFWRHLEYFEKLGITPNDTE